LLSLLHLLQYNLASLNKFYGATFNKLQIGKIMQNTMQKLIFLIVGCTLGCLANNFIVDNNIHYLSKDEQEAIVQDLMKQYPHPVSLSDSWLTENDAAWHELDMKLLIAQLDRSVSIFGKGEFEKIMHPLSDIGELERRRSVIEKLIDDNGLYENLTMLLDHYSEREWMLLSLFDKRTPFLAKLSDLRIFKENYTTNTGWLAGSLTRMRQVLEIPSTIGVIGLFAATYREDRANYAAWHHNNPHAHFLNRLRQGSVLYMRLFEIPLMLYKMVEFYETIFLHNAAIRTMHALMINLAAIINDVQLLENLIPPECEAAHRAFTEWRGYLDPESSAYCPDLDNLVTLLESDNFKREPSANLGTSFRELWNAYEYVRRSQEKIVPLMHAYGIADAYLSIAKLYKEYEHSPLALHWVSLSKEEKPYCVIDSFYNPLIMHQNVVTNSCRLGAGTQADHIILTGPHGCGKTTLMKSIADVYIMAQSTLLVPALEAELSPLTEIVTYLNITDNLSEGISSFMAEKKRMKEIYAVVQRLQKGKRCLVIIDEPYAKTLQVEGEERVYQCAADIYRIPEVMMILATHFEKPSLLEQESKGRIKNYQPELLEPRRGYFIPTFKMLEGPAGWWFEDARRRSDFIDWLGETKMINIRGAAAAT
jgi:MutS domain V